jgi:hypothetical protein
MNYLQRHPWLSALLVNLVLFAVLLLAGFPIYHSGDDAYLAYLSGGGFGQSPTNLLHYQYGFHPVIGWVIKSLSIGLPSVNWYSGILYLFHFLSCTLVLRLIIRYADLRTTAIFYALFFCCEGFFLSQPSFTNTAMVTAIAGSVCVFGGIKENNLRMYGAGYAWLLAACLLRMHVAGALVIVAVPFLVISFVQAKRYARLIVPAAVAGLLLVTAFYAQQQYYKKHIPGWQQEEAYRQLVFDHYNIPKRSTDASMTDSVRIAASFLDNGILWDKQFLSPQLVASTTKAVKLNGAWQQKDFGARVYWLLMENRLLILVMAFLFCWRLPVMPHRWALSAIASLLLAGGLCVQLLLAGKLPPYFFPGLLLGWMAFLPLLPVTGRGPASWQKWASVIIAGLLIAWAGLRLLKMNERNKQLNRQWECAYQKVSTQKTTLFLVTDDRFPIDYFYVWHAPQKYPLPNVLLKDHFLNNTYQSTFNRFGVAGPPQFANRENVHFTGQTPESILDYYQLKFPYHAHAFLTGDTSSCLPTRKLTSVSFLLPQDQR